MQLRIKLFPPISIAATAILINVDFLEPPIHRYQPQCNKLPGEKATPSQSLQTVPRKKQRLKVWDQAVECLLLHGRNELEVIDGRVLPLKQVADLRFVGDVEGCALVRGHADKAHRSDIIKFSPDTRLTSEEKEQDPIGVAYEKACLWRLQSVSLMGRHKFRVLEPAVLDPQTIIDDVRRISQAPISSSSERNLRPILRPFFAAALPVVLGAEAEKNSVSRRMI